MPKTTNDTFEFNHNQAKFTFLYQMKRNNKCFYSREIKHQVYILRYTSEHMLFDVIFPSQTNIQTATENNNLQLKTTKANGI